MPALSIKSPGKTILFGEHAVVHGQPAIAVPLNSIQLKINILARPDWPDHSVRIYNKDTSESTLLSKLADDHPIRAGLRIILDHLNIEKIPSSELTISSTIPIASGLGSSAALANALVRCISQFLGFKLSDQKVNDLAFEIEKIQHGSPSGIDNTVVTYGRPIYFVKGQAVEFLSLSEPLTLILADSGSRSLTRETVAQVGERLASQPDVIQPIFARMGEIAREAKNELQAGKLEHIGQLMTENHQLLAQLGVSLSSLDLLVQTALGAGAWGAKLCGSGRGGFMVAIADPARAQVVAQALTSTGAASTLIEHVH